MPNIYFARNGRLGNNILQYMAAKMISRVFGHTLVDYKSMLTNSYISNDTKEGQYSFSWDWFCESVIEESGWLLDHPLKKRDIYLNGYFQTAEIYLYMRPWLRSLFTLDNKELIRYGLRVCDLMAAEGVDTCGLVVHLRLDDFQAAKQVIHPRVYLEELRRRSDPITLILQKPTKQEEGFYLAMFEALRPTVISSSVLEDHATLRRAKKLMTSNSTFAWTAAFLGDADERFIMPLTGDLQRLVHISPSDTLMNIEYIDMDTYKLPEHPIPFSGEDLQGLCDYTIINKEKKDYHKGLDIAVEPSRQLFLDTTWTVPKSVGAIAIYADLVEESVDTICSYFESVRLLIIHNGDTEPCGASMNIFLEAYPRAHIYAQNNVISHPRIHSLPMGIQNRMWRQLSAAHMPPMEKKNLVTATNFGNTHPSRAVLMKTLERAPFPGLFIPPRCSQEEYLCYLAESMYSLCPPGNAHDTHRLWESLYCGARPIVLRTPFIQRLLETCPGFKLHILDTFDVVEPPTPLERGDARLFYLYIEYWRELFRSYLHE